MAMRKRELARCLRSVLYSDWRELRQFINIGTNFSWKSLLRLALSIALPRICMILFITSFLFRVSLRNFGNRLTTRTRRKGNGERKRSIGAWWCFVIRLDFLRILSLPLRSREKHLQITENFRHRGIRFSSCSDRWRNCFNKIFSIKCYFTFRLTSCAGIERVTRDVENFLFPKLQQSLSSK